MKKIAIFLTLSICLGTMFTSCKKLLDVKPKGYTIPEFYDDYAKLMNNQGLYRISAAYPAYLTDDVVAGLANDPTKGAVYTRLPQYKKQLYTFQHGSVFLPGDDDPFWQSAYNHIYVYNVVINNIMNVPDATEVDKKQLKAEALLGRAMEYLMLVNGYSAHYDASTAKTDLGVPIILTEDINATYKRNTVEEVYTRIKADLDEALEGLPAKSKDVYRPTKAVGFSFLSRMYLYMGKYTDALSNAKSALSLNSELLDYNLYTTKLGTTFGRVCLATDPSVRFPDAGTSPESIFVRLGNASSASVNAEVYVSDDLLNVFKTDLPTGAVDQRQALFFLNGSSQFGTKAVKFPGRVLYAPYVDFNLALSSPEIYLIAAECEARIGDKDKAMQYINTLRNNRIKKNVAITAATNDEALQIALNERRRELCFIGCTRLIDLKRLNKDPRFAKTITHTQEADTYTLPPNDGRYILSIPPKVLEFNPTIPDYTR